MSELSTLIREALRDEGHEMDESFGEELAGFFLQRTRLATRFAWMKMIGTLAFAIAGGVAFFLVESTRAAIAAAAIAQVGVLGFGIWWLWYWMVLNRNATLRELKRVELQIAELRAGPAAAPGEPEGPSV